MIKIEKLTPAQIAENWDVLREGFFSAMPSNTVGYESVRQTAMLDLAAQDFAQVWVALDQGKPIAYAYTIFHVDPVVRSKNLLVYAFFTLTRTKVNIWKDGVDTLLKFAKANGCLSVMAFTEEQSVVNMVRSVGGNVETRLIYKRVL